MALKQPLPFRAMAPSMIEGLAVAGSPAELGGIPQDTEAFPLVRMEPRYPRRALQRGIEGFVDLEFTISETGNVEDARVVNAEPGHIFDGAALRAIKKWKYKPMVVDGKPVKRHGVTVTLEFELEE